MLKIEVENNGLTPELLRETLALRVGQVKGFLVENRDPNGMDRLSMLLTKVSSRDIATYFASSTARLMLPSSCAQMPAPAILAISLARSRAISIGRPR
jgi:hypothetical protein